MNLKKQQMQLQLQPQPQQQQPLRRQNNRTGFETLLDQPKTPQSFDKSSSGSSGTAWSPGFGATWSPGGGTAWSPSDGGAGRYRHQPVHHYHYDHQGGAADPVPSKKNSIDGIVFVDGDDSPTGTTTAATAAAAVATTPPPPSPLSLPSPYYDRNPGFPMHHHYHHTAKSPTSAVGTVVTVPLANVQNVAYHAAGADQDHQQFDHYANNNTKYYKQRHQLHNNYKSDGRDDDKENIIKQRDAEDLQQQLDEVLRACVDYEERNKNRPQQQPAAMPVESSGSTSPGSATTATTPPQQNRIKTNGSLPRDFCKKNGAGPSSPTATLSPTSPLSQLSGATLSPSSPSSMTWTSPSPPTMSQLDGGGDSVFFDSDGFPSSSTAMAAATSTQKTTTCGSPRTKIKTLVQSSPGSANADSHYASKDDQQIYRRQHNGGSVGDGKNDDDNFPSLQSANQQPSWQTTTTWLRSSPFASADPVDSGGGGGGGAAPTSPSPVSGSTAERAAEQRRKLLVELSAHKSRLVELHLRREEVDRELIIETALLRAELDAADDETRQSENIVDGLDRAVAECRQKMDVCTDKQQEQRMVAESQLAAHRQQLQRLRSQLQSSGEDDNDALKNEIRASIEKQTELLEAEQKLYEDVEFGLLEEEAGWLARREELHRDRAAAVAIRRARRARAEWLRAQMDQLRSVGDDQQRALKADVNSVTLSIQQGHKKLQDLDHQINGNGGAATTGREALEQFRRHRFLYENSMPTTDQQQPKSLEWPWDQQMKSPVSPMSSSSSSWDQQSKSSPASPWSPGGAVNNASSGLSSPPPSSHAIADPAVHDLNGMMTNSMTTTCCSSIGSSGGEDDGCRPVSEDSTSRMSMSTIFDGGAAIKLRPKNKSSASDMTKRPLTRYLPVRYDGDDANENRMAFDLRAHIESAGHQLDDNDGDGADNRRGAGRHFWIDSSSCRGYLKKLSGAGGKNGRRNGRKWLKRWFVFDRQTRTLCYYHRRSDEHVAAAAAAAASTADLTEKKTPRGAARPRASIRFQDIQEVYVDHTNSIKGQGCAFVVKTAQRTFYLSAATGQAVRVWVDVIFTGAEGYREYLKHSTGDGDAAANDGRRAQQTKS